MRSAPKARIVRNFSGEKASEETIERIALDGADEGERGAGAAAGELHDVPGRSSPRRSAPSIIARAMRSL